MKPKKPIQGMEQLLYLRNSSFDSAGGGHIVCQTRGDDLTRQFADIRLQPQPELQRQDPQPQPQQDDHPWCSDAEYDLMLRSLSTPTVDDYWKEKLLDDEFKPAIRKEVADTALKYYNEKQGVELEVNGKITATSIHYGRGVGFHLYFQANDSSGSTKQIFAEVFRSNSSGRKCTVVFCDIMDPNDPDLLKGCRYCGSKVLHPKGVAFFKPPREPRDAASELLHRKRMREIVARERRLEEQRDDIMWE